MRAGPRGLLERSLAGLVQRAFEVGRSWLRCLKKLNAEIIDGTNDESTVEEIVLLLTRRFSDQEAAVARGPMQETPFVSILRLMLAHNGIVGTEFPEIQGIAHMLVDAASNLDQTPERPFRIRGAGIKQNAVADAGERRRCVHGWSLPDSRIRGRLL